MESRGRFTLFGLLVFVAAVSVLMAISIGWRGGVAFGAFVGLCMWTLWSDRGPQRGQPGYVRHQIYRGIALTIVVALVVEGCILKRMYAEPRRDDVGISPRIPLTRRI